MPDPKQLLSERLKVGRGTPGVSVRKNPPYKRSERACYAVIAFGFDVFIKANLCGAVRLDAHLENESITFFEPTLPGGGWALGRPKKSKRVYLRIPYKEGLPFVLNDNENHRLKELAFDVEKRTITVATTIEETVDA